MTRIAKAAVAVSIAVMVVTIAVVLGFRKQINATISELSADITVTDLSALNGAEIRPVTRSQSLERVFELTSGIGEIEPYVMRGCVIRSEQGATGIVIKGLTSFDPTGVTARNIAA